MKALDLTGQRFGRLAVLALIDERGNRNGRKWRCQCDCGRTSTPLATSLGRGRVQSCGCLLGDVHRQRATTRDMRHTRVYRAWNNMRARCSNPKLREWKHYGGRGITVCERWDSFANFLADMGEPPTGLTLDRIDPDGNYEPSNCRWVTWTEQARNTRVNRLLTFRGETRTMAEWSELASLRPSTVFSRLLRGWSVDRALTTPVVKQSPGALVAGAR